MNRQRDSSEFKYYLLYKKKSWRESFSYPVSDSQCIIFRGKVAILALNNAFPKIILPLVAKDKSATNDQTCYNVKQNCHSFKD